MFLHAFPQFSLLQQSRPEPKSKPGRPRLTYEQKSDYCRKEQDRELANTYSTLELLNALLISTKNEQFPDLRKMIKKIKDDPINYPKMIFDMEKQMDKCPKKLDPTAALSLVYDIRLSRNSYQLLRNATKVVPSKHIVNKEKLKCFPQNFKEVFKVNETSALLPLKPALEVTCQRILDKIVADEVKLQLSGTQLTMIYSLGFDGAGCQANFNQQFSGEADEQELFNSDSHLFATTMVPLRLIDSENQIVWKNPAPCSTRFCRTLHLQFKKETEQVIKEEHKRLDREMKDLQADSIVISGFQVTFEGRLSALDTKCLNGIYENKNTHMCIICGKKGKEFNVIDCDFSPLSSDRLNHGIGVLHVKLRTMEALVKVSERMEVKQYRMSKEALIEKKKEIQRSLYESLNMRFGIVKNGFGTSNTGNMARIFFAHPRTISETLNLPFDIVKNLSILMIVISCQLPINIPTFKEFLQQTRILWCQKLSWYPMPPTVHKLLAHGDQIALSSIVTLGELSEEASEGKHKDFRFVKLHLTRKVDRVSTNTDLFMHSWGSSDPPVSTVGHNGIKTRSPIPREALDLLDLSEDQKQKLVLRDRFEWQHIDAAIDEEDCTESEASDEEIEEDELNDLLADQSGEDMDHSGLNLE